MSGLTCGRGVGGRVRELAAWMVALIVGAVTLESTAHENAASAAELRVPAFTAYALPDPFAVRISERGGVRGWKGKSQSLNWYGQFAKTGSLRVRVLGRLPDATKSRLQMTVGTTRREATATGAGEQLVTFDFGEFAIEKAGYQRFVLESLNDDGQLNGDLEALTIEGGAVDGAHFNLKERRNAASVHLKYVVSKETRVAAFYSEVTAVEDPIHTFYMACGWHRGYFGMQVNGPNERRIIFSVWDSGGEAVDRKKVADDNRVKLVGKGEGVYSGDFGNEGTGGHSHLKVMWKTGQPQRFLATAEPVDETHTIFAGYWFHPEKREWMLISSWKAPKEGGWLRGLHGFSENFVGGNGHLVRKARYGNSWIRTDKGEWLELDEATFSHDPTGRSDRLDRFMGVEEGQFFLQHGGFVEGMTKYGDRFARPKTGTPPTDLDFSKLPKP